MAKLVVGLAAALFYGFVGTASLAGDIRQEPLSASESLGGEALAEATVEEVARVQSVSGFEEPTPMEFGDISEEERERRVKECERLWTACESQCERKFKAWPDVKFCKSECTEKLGACMKKIPYVS